MLSLASRRKIRPNRTSEAHIPAPVGGLNTVDPGFELPATDCPLLFNMIGGENGLRVRRGHKEWCTGVGSGIVPTILPFHGSDSGKDRLFATTSSKIYSVGASSAAPSSVLTFGSAAGDAGWGVAAAVVNAANAHFLMYCDEQNGYHVYTESTDTWAAVTMGAGATQVAGVDPANFAFVTLWKNWVLFVEKNTSKMWVGSAVRSLYGTMTSFDFGAQFPHGGYLVGLWGATGDYGFGVDNHLVAVSSSGDVVVYKGTDPTNASAFALVGSGFIGGVPKGRRIALSTGGDLFLLGSLGIIPLRQAMVSGAWEQSSSYVTQKIANEFSRLVTTYGTVKGWAMELHPEDGVVLVTVPVADGQATTQLAMSLRTGGWSKYRDLPILSMGAWGGKLYFGTVDGRVCQHTDYLDNVNLAASSFSFVKFSGITAFRNNGNPHQKQIKQFRATYLTEGAPFASAEEARYRYDLTEITPPSPVPSNNSNVFDTALFGVATFGGDFVTIQQVRGACGMGPDAAIAFAGQTGSRTVLVGIDLIYEEGGML